MMNRNFFATLLCLAASQILSASVVTNISTGQTHPDPIWNITAGGSGPAQVVTAPVWGAIAPAGSAWVSTTTVNFLPVNAAFSLETTFTTNSSSATLDYRALGDNWLDVFIDNAATDFPTFHGIVASDFNVLSSLHTVTLGAGPHTIRLDVKNDFGFSGVILSGTVTDTPEPSTFAAMGLGLVLVGLRKRRTAV